MRTTLKRGVGRGADLNNGTNGHAVFPPASVSSVSRYRQPEHKRTGLGLFSRIVLGVLLVVLAVGLAVSGAAMLWYHETVSGLRAHSQDVIIASHQLHVSRPGHAAIALVIGYDVRKGKEFSDVSRSDTVMLIRADPVTNTISLLSIPRDLGVPIYCPKNGNVPLGVQKINQAYADCEAPGTVDTVKHLSGPPDQLPDHRQLPRLPGDRRQDRRDLARRRPALLPRQQRHRRRELLEHQPAARLPAPERRAGAQLRPLPPHRRRLPPDRAPAGVRPGAQAAVRAAT